MDTREVERALNTLIDYFESGNKESDGAAKAVLAADGDYQEYWRAEIETFRQSAEWTGLRGPEAEILANRLRQAMQQIAGDK